MSARAWFRFQNVASDPTVAEIHIIDFIGDWIDDAINRFWGESIGITARAFVEQLDQLPAAVKTIRVHINSPGGDVQGGVNIANALRQQTAKGRTVETYIDGMAASIASVIAMAGSKVFMADNALWMMHNPWSIAIGNAADMRRTADILDTVRSQILASYKWHSSMSDEELIALLDGPDGQGTWMDAEEALAAGFATDKVEGLQAAASLEPRGVARITVPEKFKARVEAFLKKPDPAPAAASADDVLRLCTHGGCLDLAQELVAAKATLAQVTDRVTQAKTARAASAARETEITALCKAGKVPELAASYIAGGMPVDQVKVQLTTITAKLDRVEIDGHLDPNAGATGNATWDRAFSRANNKFGSRQ